VVGVEQDKSAKNLLKSLLEVHEHMPCVCKCTCVYAHTFTPSYACVCTGKCSRPCVQHKHLLYTRIYPSVAILSAL